MKLKDARNVIHENQNLIGRKIGKQNISVLFIAPEKRNNLAEIIGRIQMQEKYDDLLSNEINFDVFVLYDNDVYSENGVLFYESLTETLSKI